MWLKTGTLRLEITVALLIKVVLLTGLWWLIFRYGKQIDPQPDIAEHFQLPVSSSPSPASNPTSPSEISHVR